MMEYRLTFYVPPVDRQFRIVDVDATATITTTGDDGLGCFISTMLK